MSPRGRQKVPQTQNFDTKIDISMIIFREKKILQPDLKMRKNFEIFGKNGIFLARRKI